MEATHDVNNPRDEQQASDAGEEQRGPSRLSILYRHSKGTKSIGVDPQTQSFVLHTVFTEFFAGIIYE